MSTPTRFCLKDSPRLQDERSEQGDRTLRATPKAFSASVRSLPPKHSPRLVRMSHFATFATFARRCQDYEEVGEPIGHIRRLGSHGVQVVSFTEARFRTTGPAGELMIAVAAWIPKQERIRTSERVRAGLKRAKTRGTKSGKPVS